MTSHYLSTLFFFSLIIPPPPTSTLFPYTTLFRSLISFVSHPYERYVVDLYLYECRITSGELGSLAVHAFKWVTSAEFDRYPFTRSEEHTSELQSRGHLVCRLLLEKKKKKNRKNIL